MGWFNTIWIVYMNLQKRYGWWDGTLPENSPRKEGGMDGTAKAWNGCEKINIDMIYSIPFFYRFLEARSKMFFLTPFYVYWIFMEYKMSVICFLTIEKCIHLMQRNPLRWCIDRFRCSGTLIYCENLFATCGFFLIPGREKNLSDYWQNLKAVYGERIKIPYITFEVITVFKVGFT